MSCKNSATARSRGINTFVVRAAVAGLLCLPASLPAFADDSVQYQLQIAPQPLRAALQKLADQSGMEVVLSLKIAQDYVAPVLNGRYTLPGALQVLLNGTGLTFRQLNDTTIEVQPGNPGQFVRTADVPNQSASGGTNLLAQNNAAAQAPSAPAAAAPEEPQLQEVIVTGSRIARQDFTSLSPIVTVDASSIENRSQASIVNALQSLPQFHVAGNSSNLSAASNPFPSATGAAPGASTLNLRGLGTNRTLTLLDGRRAQPVDALLEIDLNSIPPDAVSSIETITGGAASTYGADAIAGVVNIKLKQNFQGFEVDAQQGISQYGDAFTTSFGAIMGGNFADNKGNVMLVVDYSKVGQADQTKREWYKAGESAPGTPGGSLYNGPNLTEFVYAAGNKPTVGAYGGSATGTLIDQNGHLFNQFAPLATGYSGPLGLGTGYKINPDGELGYSNQIPNLLLPQNRWQVLASGHYAITDSITGYVQAQFSKTYTVAQGVPSGLFSVWSPTIPYGPWDNPSSPNFGTPPAGSTFNPVPQALANLLNSRPNPNAPWLLQGSTSYFGPYSTDTTSNVYQLTAGLRGEIPAFAFTKDWTWDINGSTGESNINAQLNGFPNFGRLQTLFSANMYGQNWTNTQYPISVGGSCTSGLPLFTATGAVNTATTASANCNAYADPALNNVTTIEQNVYEGDLQGSLFDMPFNAGRLRFAVGADYRQEQFSFTPDSGYTALQAYPEIVQNIALPTAVVGTTGVEEVYTEFSIPLVKDLPFAKSIEIDPGIRFSDYSEASPGVNVSSAGHDVKTWKLLANWVVNDWVNVRGGLEVANRAPNIAELFTPLGGSALSIGADPCAVYIGTTPSYGNVPGNPNRQNVQAACQYLIARQGAPAAAYMIPDPVSTTKAPGDPTNPYTADNYQYNVFGPSPAPFPFVLGLNSGNPTLKSETARTVTVGLVLNSPFNNPYTQRLRMSVDWYQIQINGAIGVPSFGQIYQECLDAKYNSLIGSTPGSLTGAQLVAGNPYCQYINREYAPQAGDFFGAPRNYIAPYVNQGGIQSRGIDLQLDWGLRFGDTDLFKSVPGGISINIVANYLDRYAVSPFQGAAYINYTGTITNNSYRDKVLSTFGYSIGPASFGFRWQHLPPAGSDPSTPGTQGAMNAYNEVDFFTRYALTDAVELRGGIDNLVNAWPVWVGANASTTAIGSTNSNYDTVGRRFYLGVKAKL